MKTPRQKTPSSSPTHSTTSQMSLGDIVSRFHAVLFALVVGGGLTFAIILLSSAVNDSDPPSDYTPSLTNTSFDQQTIDQLLLLNGIDTPPQPAEPATGRTSPFSE